MKINGITRTTPRRIKEPHRTTRLMTISPINPVVISAVGRIAVMANDDFAAGNSGVGLCLEVLSKPAFVARTSNFVGWQGAKTIHIWRIACV